VITVKKLAGITKKAGQKSLWRRPGCSRQGLTETSLRTPSGYWYNWESRSSPDSNAGKGEFDERGGKKKFIRLGGGDPDCINWERRGQMDAFKKSGKKKGTTNAKLVHEVLQN